MKMKRITKDMQTLESKEQAQLILDQVLKGNYDDSSIGNSEKNSLGGKETCLFQN
jgi:hypothetical protein